MGNKHSQIDGRKAKGSNGEIGEDDIQSKQVSKQVLKNDWFDGRSSNQAVGVTELPNPLEEPFQLSWIIKDWSKVSSVSEKLEFPDFRGGPLTNHLWTLGLVIKKGESIRVYLGPKGIPGSLDFIECTCTFYLFVNDQYEEDQKEANNYEKAKIGSGFHRTWPWPTTLVKDDTIRILCKLRIKIPFEPEFIKHSLVTSSSALPGSPPCKETLLKDLGTLFQSKDHADLKLVVRDVEILAHKSILSVRSPVFGAMLATQMTENVEGRVVIEDFEPEVVKALLEFIYTGNTEVKEVSAADLLLIAEKYGLPQLVAQCEAVLITELATLNAAQFLKLGHLVVSAVELKNRSIDFIKRNIEEVSKSEGYQKFIKSSPELLNEILLWRK